MTPAGSFDQFKHACQLPYERQQQRLLSGARQDWLPEGPLAYFVSDNVESLDLSAFHPRYAKGCPRNRAFHPATILKVLIYDYATGIFSSRKCATKRHKEVALRALAAENIRRIARCPASARCTSGTGELVCASSALCK